MSDINIEAEELRKILNILSDLETNAYNKRKNFSRSINRKQAMKYWDGYGMGLNQAKWLLTQKCPKRLDLVVSQSEMK